MYGGKSLAGFLPVYYPEPVVDICGAQVVMFQIVCVFPDVNVQDMCAGAEYGVFWLAEVTILSRPPSDTSQA